VKSVQHALFNQITHLQSWLSLVSFSEQTHVAFQLLNRSQHSTRIGNAAIDAANTVHRIFGAIS